MTPSQRGIIPYRIIELLFFMKQIIQNFKTGELSVAEVPSPAFARGFVLVRNHYLAHQRRDRDGPQFPPPRHRFWARPGSGQIS